MSEILRFQNRLSRNKGEAESGRYFIVRDLRESYCSIDNKYINEYAGLCGLAANSVYMLLCSMVGKEQVCWPPTEHMAKKLKISKPTIMKAVKILEGYKIIRVDRAPRQSNIYALLDKSQWGGGATSVKSKNRRNEVVATPLACTMCENVGDGNGSPECIECMGGSKMVARG
jgi:hypothetical protein